MKRELAVHCGRGGCWNSRRMKRGRELVTDGARWDDDRNSWAAWGRSCGSGGLLAGDYTSNNALPSVSDLHGAMRHMGLTRGAGRQIGRRRDLHGHKNGSCRRRGYGVDGDRRGRGLRWEREREMIVGDGEKVDKHRLNRRRRVDGAVAGKMKRISAAWGSFRIFLIIPCFGGGGCILVIA